MTHDTDGLESESGPSRKGAPPSPGDTLGALTPDSPSPKKRTRRKASSGDTAPPAEKPAAKPVAAKAKKPLSQRTKPLNFRVTAEFRKQFKQAAANEDCKKVELLERVFAAWQEAQG